MKKLKIKLKVLLLELRLKFKPKINKEAKKIIEDFKKKKDEL